MKVIKSVKPRTKYARKVFIPDKIELFDVVTESGNPFEVVQEGSLTGFRLYSPIVGMMSSPKNSKSLKKSDFSLPDNEFVRSLTQVNNDQFGENWEITYYREYYKVIIFFPEIEIVNSSDEKHIIKDMYIQMFFRDNGTLIGSFKGVRGKVSYPEFISVYQHSHMSAGYSFLGMISFNDFCLGNGETNIRESILELRDKFTEDQYYLFTEALIQYLHWESLEGGPYHKMRSITIKGGLNSLFNSDLDKDLKNFYEKINSFNVDFLTSECVSLIQVSEEGIREIYKDLALNTCFYSEETNEYYSSIDFKKIKLSIQNFNNNIRPILKYKGQIVQAKIEEFLSEKEEAKKTAHPQVINWITKTLNEQTNKYLNQI